MADSTGSAGRGTFGDRRNGFDQKEKKDVILQCFCNLYGLVLKQQKGELDMKTLKKVLLSSMLAISGMGIMPIAAADDSSMIVPHNVETWYGENAGTVQGYYVKVAATMTYANGNWSCRGWLLDASSSAVSVKGALMTPGSNIVSVYISINGVPTHSCIWVTVSPR